ncbi:hypothetical protein SRO_0115 [Streptomyces rochei]|nr:hypothetical protein SRO_0115 [Streptomyces rochei]
MCVMSAERVDVAYTLVGAAARSQVLSVRNKEAWCLPGGRRECGETLRVQLLSGGPALDRRDESVSEAFG